MLHSSGLATAAPWFFFSIAFLIFFISYLFCLLLLLLPISVILTLILISTYIYIYIYILPTNNVISQKKVVVLFWQYMPSKPLKYRIKSWVTCDVKSSYAWKIQVYTGKPTNGRPEKNQGMWGVLV